MYEEYTRQALPSREYRILLGTALCVFNSNAAFIIENILKIDKTADWYSLADDGSGEKLKSRIAKSISQQNGAIYTLFSDLVDMRNRIVHSFQITDKEGKQILWTKTKAKDGNDQFGITKEYLVDFIKKNEELSDLLHKYRGH